jgi:hypothetical protein
MTEDDTILMFDFDRTLADTMPDLVDALIDTLGDRLSGDEHQRRDQIMHLIQLPPREMFQAFAGLTGWQASEIQSKAATLTARLPTHLFPEVPAVPKSLKQSGFQVVISSNNPDKSFGERLAGVGLSDQCDIAARIGRKASARRTTRAWWPSAWECGLKSSWRLPYSLVICPATCNWRVKRGARSFKRSGEQFQYPCEQRLPGRRDAMHIRNKFLEGHNRTRLESLAHVTQDGSRIVIEHQHEPSDNRVKFAFEINRADIPRAKYDVRSAERSYSLLGNLQRFSINVKPDDGALVANYLAKKQGDVPDTAADIKYVHTSANAGS